LNLNIAKLDKKTILGIIVCKIPIFGDALDQMGLEKT